MSHFARNREYALARLRESAGVVWRSGGARYRLKASAPNHKTMADAYAMSCELAQQDVPVFHLAFWRFCREVGWLEQVNE